MVIVILAIISILTIKIYKNKSNKSENTSRNISDYNGNNPSENISNTNNSIDPTNYDESTLQGTFYYNEDVKYEFDGKGNGAMYDKDATYKYSYIVQEKELSLDFENEMVHDATYTFTVEDDTLTLIGGSGTTGGKYTLKKENK